MKYLIDGQEWEPKEAPDVQVVPAGDRLRVRTSEGSATALAVSHRGTVYVSYRGRSYRIERAGRKRQGADAESSGEARAPMPGQIVDVACAVGDSATAGDRLLVLEAMKMQQPITAPLTGTVKALHVAQGDQVDEGQVLVTMEAVE